MVSCVAVAVVRTSPDVELGRRLGALADTVESWLDEHAPDVVAVERVFSQHNVALPMRERAGVARNTTWGRAASSDVEG
jgi:crossover junction endodeoxyribonuclease RuvC